ncbi:DUF4920 domain-containing protein [Enhygromyxa salina]|uniref:DUF4920 domain-containing protein n=1 Tax=Enhygromyxa salina TaxID=215803 RepID=A0A2S9YIX1_9BACT|nr:DUF4920 domain-containing protein [Enhygromyxa salina]PRQ05055.1 hypothetical protein ENSA7_48080 [Enhygromyxa salina]
MRSLPVMLSIALGLTTLTACDKKAEEKTDAKADEKTDAKTEEKADAKKAGDEVSANAVDSEEGCIHENKPADHAAGEGCDHGGTAAPAESTGHFGSAFAIADAQPLSAVLASGVPTTAVKVSGTVESVCQAKGCWMVIKEGDVTARVLVKDHAFAIPMDGKGKAATVEGTLEAKELTEANVAHLKKDGDANLEGDGARQEIFLHATAVELAANS